MTEAERLINRQLTDTRHAVRGGAFDKFNGTKIKNSSGCDKYDSSGLLRLEYPKKRA